MAAKSDAKSAFSFFCSLLSLPHLSLSILCGDGGYGQRGAEWWPAEVACERAAAATTLASSGGSGSRRRQRASARRPAEQSGGGRVRGGGCRCRRRAVTKRPGDADAVADMPRRRPGEAVAVHWLRHAMFDAAGDDGAAGGGHGRFMDRLNFDDERINSEEASTFMVRSHEDVQVQNLPSVRLHRPPTPRPSAGVGGRVRLWRGGGDR
uniref:Uncharacterized protein n=1 Tax=Oryza nivara TaxID=4536 RepID=A0A0E0ICD0_ORYNI